MANPAIAVYSVHAIDGTVVATTTVVPASETTVEFFFPIAFVFNCNIGGVLTSPPTIDIGGIANGDIVAAHALTQMTATDKGIVLLPDAGGKDVPINTALKLRVTTGAVTTGAYSFDVTVIGIFGQSP